MFFCDLETERLNLKNISVHDREFIFNQFSNNNITRYLFDEEPLKSIDGADKLIKMFLGPELRTQHRWILVQKTINVKIGTCGFHCWDLSNATVEVGYDLQEAFWGCGYMQEALKAIVLFAENTMNVKKINACIFPENIKSVAIAEKMGFKFSGETKFEYFKGNKYLHKIYSLDCCEV